MSKKKNRPISSRSDIPYLQRLQMQQVAMIAHHRDEAARIALQIGCVALNDTEGMGYSRLTRYAKRVKELIDEYYKDSEVESVHLQRRLEQLGFKVIDGHMWCFEDVETGEPVRREKVEAKTGALPETTL